MKILKFLFFIQNHLQSIKSFYFAQVKRVFNREIFRTNFIRTFSKRFTAGKKFSAGNTILSEHFFGLLLLCTSKNDIKNIPKKKLIHNCRMNSSVASLRTSKNLENLTSVEETVNFLFLTLLNTIHLFGTKELQSKLKCLKSQTVSLKISRTEKSR